MQLKIYHMRGETIRADTDEEQLKSVSAKLAVLEEQNIDLQSAIDHLLMQMAAGEKVMKVYKQMKMYNDPNLNPILYGKRR